MGVLVEGHPSSATVPKPDLFVLCNIIRIWWSAPIPSSHTYAVNENVAVAVDIKHKKSKRLWFIPFIQCSRQALHRDYVDQHSFRLQKWSESHKIWGSSSVPSEFLVCLSFHISVISNSYCVMIYFFFKLFFSHFTEKGMSFSSHHGRHF